MADRRPFLAGVVAAGLGWAEETMEAVMAAYPYRQRVVSMRIWVGVVAEVSAAKAEDPRDTAERLALYVQTFRERYLEEPHPDRLRSHR